MNKFALFVCAILAFTAIQAQEIGEDGSITFPVNDKNTYEGILTCQDKCQCITEGFNICHQQTQAYQSCIASNKFESCYVYNGYIRVAKEQDDLSHKIDNDLIIYMQDCHKRCSAELTDIEAKYFGQCWVGCSANIITLSMFVLALIALLF